MRSCVTSRQIVGAIFCLGVLPMGKVVGQTNPPSYHPGSSSYNSPDPYLRDDNYPFDPLPETVEAQPIDASLSYNATLNYVDHEVQSRVRDKVYTGSMSVTGNSSVAVATIQTPTLHLSRQLYNAMVPIVARFGVKNLLHVCRLGASPRVEDKDADVTTRDLKRYEETIFLGALRSVLTKDDIPDVLQELEKKPDLIAKLLINTDGVWSLKPDTSSTAAHGFMPGPGMNHAPSALAPTSVAPTSPPPTAVTPAPAVAPTSLPPVAVTPAPTVAPTTETNAPPATPPSPPSPPPEAPKTAVVTVATKIERRSASGGYAAIPLSVGAELTVLSVNTDGTVTAQTSFGFQGTVPQSAIQINDGKGP